MARILLAASLVLLGASPAQADLPPLIPRTILFGNLERSNPQVSPDGRSLAWLAPDEENVLQVWVRPLSGPKAKMVTADRKRGIRQYHWTYRRDELLYLQDTEGDENYHVYQVNVKTAVVRNLTPLEGVRAEITELDPGHPNEALVSLNIKTKARLDVYRLNLESGAAEFVMDNPGNVLGWVADAQFKIRAGVASNRSGGSDLIHRATMKDAFRTLRSWNVEEQGVPVGFSRNGKTLFLRANHDADTMRLLSLNLESGVEKVLAEDAAHDLSAVLFHPTKRTVQAAAFQRDKLVWQAVDPALKNDLETLGKALPGQFNVVSRDLADENWVVSYTRDDGPTTHALYRRGKPDKPVEVLFTSLPALEKWQLAKMASISYKARDGLKIHGYLTLPVGIAPKKLPTALLVHGGPWTRDNWGCHNQVQWLANRGYAVLQVNFRGSGGYGKKFLNAGNKEWAGKMHDDLIDAVHWLVEQGTADPKRVGIMGSSYGGYATLVGLAFTPEVFCCGVDIVGPSNIVSLLKAIPPYWASMKTMFNLRVGDVEKDEEFLKSRSPLFHVHKIKAPLLIGQGANDPRVKQAESDQIVAALRKSGKKVDYLLYSDEGHGLQRPENRQHFYAHTEQFLAKHLGGRAEAIGEIKGHSGVVK